MSKSKKSKKQIPKPPNTPFWLQSMQMLSLGFMALYTLVFFVAAADPRLTISFVPAAHLMLFSFITLAITFFKGLSDDF